MGLVGQIIIQLIVGVAAFVAGLFLQRIRASLLYLQSRRFWRPVLRRDLMVVLGDGFAGLRRFEASDVIGRGDLVASYELVTHFARMGYRRMQPVFADRVVNDQPGRSLRHNMVVLGGPDANSVSKACLEGVRATYQLIWPEDREAEDFPAEVPIRPPQLVLMDSSKRDEIPILKPTVAGDEVTRDYGVIIRTRNPFDYWGPKRLPARGGSRIVIMYGCYGYGTIAAVLYSRTLEFLEMIKNSKDDIECIVSCDIVMGTPQAIGQVFFRSHPYGHLVRRPTVTDGTTQIVASAAQPPVEPAVAE